MEYLIGWMSTIAATSIIKLFTSLNILKDVADQGYKLNLNKMHENVGGFSVGNDDTGSDKIVDYVPLVNVMNSLSQYAGYLSNRETVLMALDQLNVVEEMDIVEKTDYNKNPSFLSVIKLYKNEARKKEEEMREKELKYSLQKIHEMHVIEEYMEYFGSREKSFEEYEKDKDIRLKDNDRNLEEKLEEYRYIDLGEGDRIYYSIDNNKGIYSLDDFRVVYMKGKFDNDDVTFNERKVGYFLSVIESDKNTETETNKVNKLNRK